MSAAIDAAADRLALACKGLVEARAGAEDIEPHVERVSLALAARKAVMRALASDRPKDASPVAPWPAHLLAFRLEVPLGKVEVLKPKPRKPRKDGTFPPRPKGTMNVEIAPTLNAYKGMKPFVMNAARDDLDDRIAALVPTFPRALAHGARRGVFVVRYSSREPDEISCDVLGFKIPGDRLVVAGVLAGDSRKHLERSAHWRPAKPKQGRLVVEVYDLPWKDEARLPGKAAGLRAVRRR